MLKFEIHCIPRIGIFSAAFVTISATGLFKAIVPGEIVYLSVALLYILSPKAKPLVILINVGHLKYLHYFLYAICKNNWYY